MSLARASQLVRQGLGLCKNELKDVFQVQKRHMGDYNPDLLQCDRWIMYRSYDGKPPPKDFQGPEYVTYAGVTVRERVGGAWAWDRFFERVMFAPVWFTMMYMYYHEWPQLVYGEMYLLEYDVQLHGTDDVHPVDEDLLPPKDWKWRKEEHNSNHGHNAH